MNTYTKKNPSAATFFKVSQGHIHKYEDLQRKIYNCNAITYFNQKCLWKNIIPNFAMIKIPNTSLASKFTQQKASKLYFTFYILIDYINQEI
jgi:hypothetical protein